MSNDSFSQDQLDSLLDAVSDVESTELSQMEKDAANELGGVVVQVLNSTLNTLTGRNIEIEISEVGKASPEKLRFFDFPVYATKADFVQGLPNDFQILWERIDAARIFDLMLMEDGTHTDIPFNDEFKDGLSEVGNNIFGGLATTLGNSFGRQFSFSSPEIFEFPESQLPILADYAFFRTSFNVEGFDPSEMVFLIHADSLSQLLAEEEDAAQQSAFASSNGQESAADGGFGMDFTQTASAQGRANGSVKGLSEYARPEISQAEFSQLMEPTGGRPKVHAPENIDLLMDVQLDVIVELGRTTKLIREVLDFKKGSIIELNKLSGEPVDILVNGRIVARGEVVVVDEYFGVKITSLIGKEERIQNLRG